ncbi:MAG TPA: hypothetical protein VFA18_08035, partial [Gemmataceae bacterium]|nr:hypothetical protein [Gemmataceae bacterium]
RWAAAMQTPTNPDDGVRNSTNMVRERFLAAWGECLKSGAAQPEVEQFLESLPEQASRRATGARQ